MWQKHRHSAPLLSSRAAPAIAAKEPRIAEGIASPAQRRARPAVFLDGAAQMPAEKPAPQKSLAEKSGAGGSPGQTAAKISPVTQSDQISDLLKAAEIPQPVPSASAAKASGPSKSVLAAQRALQKLGFVLKPDGLAGAATRQAIKQFERARGLPIRGELTPALVRQLTAEAGL